MNPVASRVRHNGKRAVRSGRTRNFPGCRSSSTSRRQAISLLRLATRKGAPIHGETPALMRTRDFPGRRDQRLIRAVATRPLSGPDVGNAAASLLLPGVSGVVVVRGSGQVVPVRVDLDPGPPGLAAGLVGVAACEQS